MALKISKLKSGDKVVLVDEDSVAHATVVDIDMKKDRIYLKSGRKRFDISGFKFQLYGYKEI